VFLQLPFQSPDFERVGIDANISELKRHAMARIRSRRVKKVALWQDIVGAACNVTRRRRHALRKVREPGTTEKGQKETSVETNRP
jgi:hypothetical protein